MESATENRPRKKRLTAIVEARILPKDGPEYYMKANTWEDLFAALEAKAARGEVILNVNAQSVPLYCMRQGKHK